MAFVKEAAVEAVKQLLHGKIRGAVRDVVAKNPQLDKKGILDELIRFAGPLVVGLIKTNFKHDIDAENAKGIVADILADMPREISQEFDAALNEKAGGSATIHEAATAVTGFVAPKVWSHMERPHIAFHPDCAAKHHLGVVTEQKRDKEGKPVGEPRKKEIVEDGFHEIAFETFLLSGVARAPETEKEGYRRGCACHALIERDRISYVTAKTITVKAAPSKPVFVKAAEPSFAELAGQMPTEAVKIDDLIAGITRSTGPDGVEIVTTRTDIEPWRRKALAKALEECNTRNEFQYLSRSVTFESLEFKVKTLREHRVRGTVELFLGRIAAPFATIAAIDHQLADDGAKYAAETERALMQRKLLRDYATPKGLRLEEVLLAVRVAGVAKYALHELTFEEIDACVIEKKKGEKETALRAYAAERWITLEAVQEEIGKRNGFVPSFDQLVPAHVDFCVVNATHLLTLPQEKGRMARLGNWLVHLIVPPRPQANGPRLGGWLRL